MKSPVFARVRPRVHSRMLGKPGGDRTRSRSRWLASVWVVLGGVVYGAALGSRYPSASDRRRKTHLARVRSIPAPASQGLRSIAPTLRAGPATTRVFGCDLPTAAMSSSVGDCDLGSRRPAACPAHLSGIGLTNTQTVSRSIANIRYVEAHAVSDLLGHLCRRRGRGSCDQRT